MSEPSGDHKGGDELLDKLDRLLQRHRRYEDKLSIPTLPATSAADDIPVLTDAVSGPNLSRGAPGPALPAQAAIEARLCSALGREVNRLQAEVPQYSRQLATVSATLSAAIRLLLQRYLGDYADSRGDDPERRA